MSIRLEQALSDYLAVRRAMGFKLLRAQKLLTQFVGWLDDQNVDTVTVEHALAWVMLPADAAPRWWQHRMSTVRGFALYLHTLDPHVEVRRNQPIPASSLTRSGKAQVTGNATSIGTVHGGIRGRLVLDLADLAF